MVKPPLERMTEGAVAVGAGFGETPAGHASVKEIVAVPGVASTNGVGEAAVVPGLTCTLLCVSGVAAVTACPVPASTYVPGDGATLMVYVLPTGRSPNSTQPLLAVTPEAVAGPLTETGIPASGLPPGSCTWTARTPDVELISPYVGVITPVTVTG